MAHNGFKVMDSDMHVQEPFDLWLNYIDPAYKHRAPIGTNEYLSDLHLMHDGQVISRDRRHIVEDDIVLGQAERYGRLELFQDYDERGWGSDVQLEAMDKEGIDVAVLYPTRGLIAHAKEYDDDGLAAAISRAYNDWLADLCAPAPQRMYGAAMLPAQCVDAAVEEVKRTRQEYGFKAVFLRPNPVRGRNWNNPVYDPLWAECEKQGMAVGFHEGLPCVLPVAVGGALRRRPRGPLADRARRLACDRADVRLPIDDRGWGVRAVPGAAYRISRGQLQLAAFLAVEDGRALRGARAQAQEANAASAQRVLQAPVLCRGGSRREHSGLRIRLDG